MIKSIKKIKNIRNLIDFQSLNDLTANSRGESGKIKNAIIYALNGTGKTTISRLLSFLQSDKIDIEQLNDLISVEATENHEKIQFEIELIDGTIISEQKIEVPNSKFFFVYNEDFLKQNIDIPDFCENKKHNGEIVVGTVDSNEIKIKSLEKQKREHEKQLELEKKKIQIGISDRLKKFKKEYRAIGDTYGQILSEENFYKDDVINELKIKLGESNPKTIFKDIENIDENDKIKKVLSKLNDILFDDLVTNNIHKSFKFEDIQIEVEERIENISSAVKIWLWVGFVMILLQILIGGVTRLTGSGLSITKWEIITGTIPPLNEPDWNIEFDKYKETPQYQKINKGMSLQDFKFIYFWEYFHRLWARLMGFVFLMPAIFFGSEAIFHPG